MKKFDFTRVRLFDGAMGTRLQALGFDFKPMFEEINITHPEAVQSVHAGYIEAGADFITTNTFGVNNYHYAHSKYSIEEVILAAINNAKKHATDRNFIVLGIGPIGRLMKPSGDMTFDEAYAIFKDVVDIAKPHVDAVLFETFSDLYEMKAGILAVKENSALPVFATMTFESNGRTLMGTDIETMVYTLERLNVDALGVNCSLGPIELAPIIRRMLAVASLPVIIQPNAGLPHVHADGSVHYQMKPEVFVDSMREFIAKGASIIGGCCGTNPATIEGMARNYKNVELQIKEKHPSTLATTSRKTIHFDDFRVVGERMNPTGKPKFEAAILNRDYDSITKEARLQVEAGAAILDLNVGVPTINEAQAMKDILIRIQDVVDAPLMIDSSSIEALEAGCRYYNGIPILNSVNGKSESLHNILPIAKKYGATIVALALDDQGIPDTYQERIRIIEHILETGKQYGLEAHRFLFDPMVLPVSADIHNAKTTLDTLSNLPQGKYKTIMGVSNVSFGLPERKILNRSFLTMAMSMELSSAILNPTDKEIMHVVQANRLLLSQSKTSDDYIAQVTGIEASILHADTLYEAILSGLKGNCDELTRTELKTRQPMQVVDEVIIKALATVGDQFNKGEVYVVGRSGQTSFRSHTAIDREVRQGKRQSHTGDRQRGHPRHR
jgi:5-methyltetrahydrofolate--homocysteine methyltransferase